MLLLRSQRTSGSALAMAPLALESSHATPLARPMRRLTAALLLLAASEELARTTSDERPPAEVFARVAECRALRAWSCMAVAGSLRGWWEGCVPGVTARGEAGGGRGGVDESLQFCLP